MQRLVHVQECANKMVISPTVFNSPIHSKLKCKTKKNRKEHQHRHLFPALGVRVCVCLLKPVTGQGKTCPRSDLITPINHSQSRGHYVRIRLARGRSLRSEIRARCVPLSRRDTGIGCIAFQRFSSNDATVEPTTP